MMLLNLTCFPPSITLRICNSAPSPTTACQQHVLLFWQPSHHNCCSALSCPSIPQLLPSPVMLSVHLAFAHHHPNRLIMIPFCDHLLLTPSPLTLHASQICVFTT